MVEAKQMEWDCSQWCPVTGQEKMDMNWNNRHFH